jgi:hypothetical protein
VRSFSLTWTSDIQDNEAIVFVSAVHEALKTAWDKLSSSRFIRPPEIRPFGNWYLEGVESESDYASFQWYQDQTTDPETGSLYADRFLVLIMNEPWQHKTPHYDISLLHQLLLDASGPVFGAAKRGRAAALSVHAIRDMTDQGTRLLMLRRLTAHYVGQAIAIPIPDQRKEAHCTNLCAMRPAENLAMLITYASQELDAGVLYCNQCQDEMAQRLVGSHFGNN